MAFKNLKLNYRYLKELIRKSKSKSKTEVQQRPGRNHFAIIERKLQSAHDLINWSDAVLIATSDLIELFTFIVTFIISTFQRGIDQSFNFY